MHVNSGNDKEVGGIVLFSVIDIFVYNTYICQSWLCQLLLITRPMQSLLSSGIWIPLNVLTDTCVCVQHKTFFLALVETKHNPLPESVYRFILKDILKYLKQLRKIS